MVFEIGVIFTVGLGSSVRGQRVGHCESSSDGEVVFAELIQGAMSMAFVERSQEKYYRACFLTVVGDRPLEVNLSISRSKPPLCRT